MRIMLTSILVLAIASVSIKLEAGDCPCEVQDAKATGEGTCSIVEDSDYCRIRYSADSNSSETIALAESNREKFDVMMEVERTYDVANEPISRIDEARFRGMLVNMISLSGGDLINQEYDDYELRGLIERVDDSYQELYFSFSKMGCMRYEDSETGILLRILHRTYQGDPECG